MSKNRMMMGLILWCFIGSLIAQDVLPGSSDSEGGVFVNTIQVDTISTREVLPKAFRGIGNNVVSDPSGSLSSIFERLYLLRTGLATDSLRIVHVGDSHIRGRVYPQTVDSLLQLSFGPVSYMDMGINGATNLTFAYPERVNAITKLKPELLILSFGTNESHNRSYNKDIHYEQIDKFITMLREDLPETPILLTTPPGSYDNFRRRRHHTYVVNPRTATAARVISNYATKHHLAVWDLYNVVGGSRQASANWLRSSLMRPDHVHYTSEGYMVQGELLYGAIIKAYNTYVSHKY